jgi:hypothetical protein
MVADTTVQGGIRGLFEGLVPGEVIDAYDRLLASNGCAKEQAEALVGDAGLVATLTEWGMAHVQPHSPADPAWLRPASPDLALQGVLVGHQVRLTRDQELLLAGHRRLADAQARYGMGMNGRFPRTPGGRDFRPGGDQRAVGRIDEYSPQGLDDPGEPAH